MGLARHRFKKRLALRSAKVSLRRYRVELPLSFPLLYPWTDVQGICIETQSPRVRGMDYDTVPSLDLILKRAYASSKVFPSSQLGRHIEKSRMVLLGACRICLAVRQSSLLRLFGSLAVRCAK